jgi:hypothetical protein
MPCSGHVGQVRSAMAYSFSGAKTFEACVFRRAQAVRAVVHGYRLHTVSDTLHFPVAALRTWVHRCEQEGIAGPLRCAALARLRLPQLLQQLPQTAQFVTGACIGSVRSIQERLPFRLGAHRRRRRGLHRGARRFCAEHPRQRTLQRLLHGNAIPQPDNHALQLWELPLLGGNVEWLHIHQRALDGDDEEIPADHLGAPLVPQRELLGDEQILFTVPCFAETQPVFPHRRIARETGVLLARPSCVLCASHTLRL